VSGVNQRRVEQAKHSRWILFLIKINKTNEVKSCLFIRHIPTSSSEYSGFGGDLPVFYQSKTNSMQQGMISG
jgi:hypothetical protein